MAPPLRRWKLLILFPLTFAVLAAAVSLIMQPKYTGVATFSQETSSPTSLSSLAGLAGLAGQLGLAAGSAGTLTPDFLASVVKSRELLAATLASEFPDPKRPDTRRQLLDLLEVEGKSELQRVNNGVRRLGRLAEASVDRKTGIVTLSVTLPDAKLAADVANRMTALLDQFNLQRRQTQSRQQRRFVGERLAQAERELRAAEQQQVQFLQRNRRYTQSPLLAFEANRLDRAVRTKQEVFLSLTKSYEDARIAEVRDTPSLTIIDRAVPPTIRTSPHRKLLTLVGFVLGGAVGLAVVYLAELRRSLRREDRADYRALADAWSEARGEMTGSLRRRER